MATLLLVDGVSWGNQQAGASAFLSSLQRSDLPVPPCSCDRHHEPSMVATTTTTTRCASSNNLFDRLDPPLPRFPSHQQPRKPYEVSRYQVTLENKPNLNLVYVDESFSRSEESSLNDPWNNLEQPSSPGNGDTSNRGTSFTDGQEFDMRRSQRNSPSYMSISRSRRAMSNGATSQLVQAPMQNKDLKGGPSGFYVGLAAIMLGLAAVLQKGGLLGLNGSPTTMCSTCNGYGMKPCNLCKGRGSVTWEGKLRHTDLCPSCFGARVRKCSECRGYRTRSDEPPFLQQISKARSIKARP